MHFKLSDFLQCFQKIYSNLSYKYGLFSKVIKPTFSVFLCAKTNFFVSKLFMQTKRHLEGWIGASLHLATWEKVWEQNDML